MTKSPDNHKNCIPIKKHRFCPFMSRRYWNIHKKRSPARWDASWECQAQQDLAEYRKEKCGNFEHDLDETTKSTGKSDKARLVPLGECPICFEARPLLSIGRTCWHQPACRDCLRGYFVIDAQQDINNFPLKCFHPQCNLRIRGEQLEKLGLFECAAEKAKHYYLAELAKRKRHGDSCRLIHCPSCDHPRIFQDRCANREITFNCHSCHKSFTFSPDFYTLQAIERFKADSFGANNGYGYCPSCGILISKGDGDDSMVCFCGKEFPWSEAREKMERKNLGRIPYEEMPLSW